MAIVGLYLGSCGFKCLVRFFVRLAAVPSGDDHISEIFWASAVSGEDRDRISCYQAHQAFTLLRSAPPFPTDFLAA